MPGQTVEVFDHRDFRTQAAPYRTQLQADDAGADHHQVLGHLGNRQRAGGVEDALVVDFHARQRGGLGTGGDDDVLGGEAALAAVGGGHFHLARPVDAAPALHPVHLVLAEEEFHALGQRGHALGLLLHHLRQVQLGLDLDAEVGELAAGRRFVQFRRVQQRLGRHAADIQAGATEGFAALHAGNFQAQLARANGRVVAAGAAADDDHIVCAHAVLSELEKGVNRG